MKILGMGMPELLIILAVALLIFGPKNLPKLGASLGKTVKSLREGMSSDTPEENVELAVEDVEDVEEEPARPATKKATVKVAKKAEQTA